MSTKLRRILVVAVSLLVVLGVLIAMIPVAIVPYLARQSFPETDGELHLANLDDEVDIYRDQMGIPHIYASSLHDLFFAQGYVHIAAQNLLYADVEANIAYQNPGNIPLRPISDGTLPVPGWIDDDQWQGYIPFAELPHVLNPPGGIIVTANNRSHPIDYPALTMAEY